ncbi:MAG: tape measure protein, partial [Beijerinckiaceae bacterium]
MALVVGTLQVVLETQGIDRFSGSMRNASTEVRRSSAQMTTALGRTTSSVSSLSRSASQMTAGNSFRALGVSILRANDAATQLKSTMLLLPALMGGIGAAALVRSTGQLAESAAQIRNRLSVVTQTTSERVALEQRTFEIAQRTRSEYNGTAMLISRMVQASQNLGRSQSDVLRFVESVQQTAQISGAGTMEARAAAMQLAQGLGSGRFAGDELKSVLENNIALAQVLAEELAGGSVGRLRDMGSEGLLDAQKVMDAVLRRSKDIGATFSKQGALPSAGITLLTNALTKYVGELDQSLGGSQALFNIMQRLADIIPVVGNAALVAGALISGSFIGRGLTSAGGGISAMRAASAKLVDMKKQETKAAAEAASAELAQAQQRAKILALQEATARAAPDDAVASRSTVAQSQRDQAKLVALGKIKESEAKKLAKLDDEAIKSTARVADLTVAGQDKASAAIRRATQQRQAAYAAEQKSLYSVQQQAEKNALALSRLQNSKLPAQQVKTARLSQSIDENNPESVRRYTQELQRLERIESQIAQRRQRDAGFGSTLTLQAAAVRQAEAASRATLSADEARLDNAKSLIAANSTLSKINDRQVQQRQKLADLDQKIAQQAQRSVGSSTQVSLEAESNRAAQTLALADANDALVRSMDAEKTAKFNAGLAEQARQMTRAHAAAAGAMRVMGSFYSFIGGPWGLALAGLSAGLAAYGLSTAKAAAETEKYKAALNDLPALLERVREAQERAFAGGGSVGDLISAQAEVAKLTSGMRDQIEAVFREVAQSQDVQALRTLLQDIGLKLSAPSPGTRSGVADGGLANMIATLRTTELTTDQVKRLTDGLLKMAEASGMPIADLARIAEELRSFEKAVPGVNELTKSVIRLDGALNTIRPRSATEQISSQAKDQAQAAKNSADAYRQAQDSRTTALRQFGEEQAGSIRLAEEELRLVGANAVERAVLLARIQAENELRQRGLSIATQEGQVYLKNAEQLARLSAQK